jgi:hypothetical protein
VSGEIWAMVRYRVDFRMSTKSRNIGAEPQELSEMCGISPCSRATGLELSSPETRL